MRRLSTEKYFKNPVIRRYSKIATFAVFGVVTLIASVLFLYGHHQDSLEEVIEVEIVQEGLGSAEPLHLRIPSIGVDALFEEPLGVDSAYEIEVPESYDTVGWYKHGPTPGEVGPAVILGHVDSFEGPAVLYSLGQVKVGEIIEVDRKDGSTAVFEVESLERHAQSGFPTAKVYSDLDYPGLRLITCSGIYDQGIQRYSHNLIVFARLVEDEDSVERERE